MNLELIGKKLGMSQVYDKDNNLVPVTIIEAGPCPVLQIKTLDKDGYEAVQIGFNPNGKPPNKSNKCQVGRAQKANFQSAFSVVHIGASITNLVSGQNKTRIVVSTLKKIIAISLPYTCPLRLAWNVRSTKMSRLDAKLKFLLNCTWKWQENLAREKLRTIFLSFFPTHNIHGR